MTTALNLTIDQGANFSQAITVGIGYNGRTPTAKVYDRFGGTLLATFACTAVNAGSTTLSLTAAQTAALRAPAYARDDERSVRIGFYELTDDNGGVITRLTDGEVNLRRQASA